MEASIQDMNLDRMDGLSVAKLFFEGRRLCCFRKLEAIWFQQWGNPLHTLSLSDLFCECHSRTDNRRLHRDSPCPNYGELKLFDPMVQELLELHPSRLEGAKATRRACFNDYAGRHPRRAGIPLDFNLAGDVLPLPHDLLLFSTVLPHLPLQDVFRARAVCRLWHEILSSPLHLRGLTTNPDWDRPRLIVQTSTRDHLSCLAIFDHDHWLPNPIPLPPFCLRAAAGGLLCFSFETAMGCWEDRMLLVGNPLTQQWRRLPSVPGRPHTYTKYVSANDVACSMWADPSQGRYKIFVLEGALYIYDSSSNKWEVQSIMYSPRIMSSRKDFGLARFRRRECSVSPSGLFHQLSLNGQVVFSYDMEDGSTSYVKTYGPSNMDEWQLKEPFSRLPALAYCNGRVFVVARIKADTPMAGGRLPWVVQGPVAIWQLDAVGLGDMGRWGWPISEAPQDLLEGAIEGSDGTDFCVTTDGDKAIYLVLPGGDTMLVYDVTSGEWSSLPGCPNAYRISFHPQPYYVPLLWLGPL